MTTRSLLLCVALLAGCGGGSDPVTSPPPGPPPPTPPPPPAVIALVSGDTQIGSINSVVRPLQVLVTQGGAGLANQNVLWITSSGTLAPPQGLTSPNGSASAVWTLGPISGPQTAVAYLGNTNGPSITFNSLAAVASPGPVVEVDLFTAGGARFDPAAVIVTAGTTVKWVWKDGTHSVLSNGTPAFTNGSTADPPNTHSFTFTAPGTYRYYCLEHGAPGSGMYGVVVVQ